MIIAAWWLQKSSNLSGQEFKNIEWNIGSLETPKQVRIPPITKLVTAMKNVLIVQQLVSDAAR